MLTLIFANVVPGRKIHKIKTRGKLLYQEYEDLFYFVDHSIANVRNFDWSKSRTMN